MDVLDTDVAGAVHDGCAHGITQAQDRSAWPSDGLEPSTPQATTGLHHLYTKLGAHRRGEAVERARGLGLLAGG